jgi:hypothetical protein
MTTMTMPTTIGRTKKKPATVVSHLTPFLLAMAFLAATGVISMLISGPMH